MNKLQWNASWALVVLIGIEATLRKYLFASPAVVVIKYAFIVFLICKLFRINGNLFVVTLFVSSLPVLLTVRSIEFIPYAIYDYLTLAIVPIFSAVTFLSKKVTAFPNATKLLWCIAFIGVLNSILIIAQFFVGPSHWLSATVDQQFSQHLFGELQKSPGLGALSSPLLSVAGLASLLAIRKMEKKSFKVVFLSGAIIIASVFFNLTSRTYFFGVVLYPLLVIFIAPALRQASFYRILQVSAIAVGAFALYISFSDIVTNSAYLTSSRVFGDFSSASSRMLAQGLAEVMNADWLKFPSLFGLGLGYTVNNNPYADIIDLPSYCSQFTFGVEGEFERIACAFGIFGFFIVLLRVVLALLILLQIRYRYISALPCLSALYLYSAFLLLNGLQVKQNDSSSGLVLICMVALLIKSSLVKSRTLVGNDLIV